MAKHGQIDAATLASHHPAASSAEKQWKANHAAMHAPQKFAAKRAPWGSVTMASTAAADEQTAALALDKELASVPC
jgi:hypothetical protein